MGMRIDTVLAAAALLAIAAGCAGDGRRAADAGRGYAAVRDAGRPLAYAGPRQAAPLPPVSGSAAADGDSGDASAATGAAARLPLPAIEESRSVVVASGESESGARRDNVQRADAQFGRDEEYRWLTGRLEYRHRERRWHIRYAPLSDEDRYGGCVAVAGLDPAQEWREGEWVHVEGHLRPAADPAEPVFDVHSAARLAE